MSVNRFAYDRHNLAHNSNMAVLQADDNFIHLVKILPFILIITAQFLIHLRTGFSVKRSCLGALANLPSLGNPKAEKETEDEKRSVFSHIYHTG